MAKVKYYAKENSTIGTHSFYAVPIPNGAANGKSRLGWRGAGGMTFGM